MTVVSIRESIDRTYERMNDAIESQHLLESFTAPRPSTAERLAAGKALRDKVSRKAQGQYEKSPDRADPVAILEKQNLTRAQKLVPVRFARMLASPFAFLRGSAAVMAADLSTTPVSASASAPAATCTSPTSASSPRPSAT